MFITGCYFYFNRSGNFLMDGAGISAQLEFVNTRFDRAGGNPTAVGSPLLRTAPGVRIYSGQLIRFTNCTTDANMGNGIEVINNSTSASGAPSHIEFVNCTFTRDGTGNPSSGEVFAGLKVTSNTTSTVGYVKCVNCTTVRGLADDSGGNTTMYGPKYAVWYDNTAHFQWIGGDANADGDANHPVSRSYYTGGGNNYQPLIIDIKRGLMTLPLINPNTSPDFGNAKIPAGTAYYEWQTNKFRIFDGTVWRSTTMT